MNELQVNVTQTQGVIKWNFEELKEALQTEMQVYEGMVYDDNAIPAARSDLAMLRKLRKSVEDRRKEIKNKCLEPYNLIEKQAKELTVLIDKPVSMIDSQVKKYEAEQAQKKKELIISYMKEQFSCFDDELANRLRFKVYDVRWENATTPMKAWKEAILEAKKQTEDDLKVIGDVDEDFRDASMAVYRDTLLLNAAMQKANELRRQKEIVLENERRRQEAERRRLEEERRRQEELKAAAEAQAVSAHEEKHEPVPDADPSMPSVGDVIEDIERNAFSYAAGPDIHEGKTDWTHFICFKGTEEQMNKVIGYIRYIGAECEVAYGIRAE